MQNSKPSDYATFMLNLKSNDSFTFSIIKPPPPQIPFTQNYVYNLCRGAAIGHLLLHKICRNAQLIYIETVTAESYSVQHFDVHAKINLACFHFKDAPDQIKPSKSTQ